MAKGAETETERIALGIIGSIRWVFGPRWDGGPWGRVSRTQTANSSQDQEVFDFQEPCRYHIHPRRSRSPRFDFVTGAEGLGIEYIQLIEMHLRGRNRRQCSSSLGAWKPLDLEWSSAWEVDTPWRLPAAVFEIHDVHDAEPSRSSIQQEFIWEAHPRRWRILHPEPASENGKMPSRDRPEDHKVQQQRDIHPRQRSSSSRLQWSVSVKARSYCLVEDCS